jgi:hypothetical protein
MGQPASAPYPLNISPTNVPFGKKFQIRGTNCWGKGFAKTTLGNLHPPGTKMGQGFLGLKQ